MIWDELVEKHTIPLVGIARDVLKTPDNHTNLRYRFAVAAKYQELDLQSTYEGDGNGCVSGETRKLQKAMELIAEQKGVSQNYVRQASTEPYSSQEQFITDLQEVENCLNEWHNERSSEPNGRNQ